MKHIFLISLCLALVLNSCEEYPEQGSFDNPILKYHGDAYVDIGASIAETQNGYALGGMRSLITRSVNSTGGSIIESSEEDLAVIQTDNEGNLNWLVTSGNTGYDQGKSILALEDGSVICSGSASITDNTSLSKEIIVIKIGSNGSVEWRNTFGGIGNQEANDIIECYDSGFLIVGSTDTENNAVGFGNNNPAGKQNVFIMKLNSQGDSLWSFSYGFSGNDIGMKLSKDIGGTGYMVLATTDNVSPGQAQNSIMFFRINGVGSATNYKTFGSTSNENAVDFVLLPDGYFLLGSSGVSNDFDNEMYLLKLSDNIFAQPLAEKRISMAGKRLVLKSICRHPDDFYVIAGGIGDALSEDMLFYFMNSDGSEFAEPHIPKGTGSQIVYDAIIDHGGSVVSVGTNGTETSSLISFYKFKPPGV